MLGSEGITRGTAVGYSTRAAPSDLGVLGLRGQLGFPPPAASRAASDPPRGGWERV